MKVRKRCGSPEGSVLFVVILLLAAVSAVVLSWSAATARRLNFLETEGRRLDAELACFSGYQWVLNRLLTGVLSPGELLGPGRRPLSPRVFLDNSPFPLDLGNWNAGPVVTVAIQDCAGLLNPLVVPDQLLRRWLRQQSGCDQLAADTAMDCLLDWIDADDLRRLQGAESREYAAAGLSPPANRLPGCAAELELVARLSAPLRALMQKHLDFTPTHARFNPNTASAAALAVFPGITPTQVAAIRARRRQRFFSGVKDLTVVVGYDFEPFAAWLGFCTSRSGYVTIGAGFSESEEFVLTLRLDRGRVFRGVERLRSRWRNAEPPDLPREIHLQRWREGTRSVRNDAKP